LHTFRRVHSFGPSSAHSPGNAEDVRYRSGLSDSNVEMLKETNVGFVRLWVWWSLLQPHLGFDPGTENVTSWPYDNDARRRCQPGTHRQSLDDQLSFIKGHSDPEISNLKVILAVWRFPSWVNQTTITGASESSRHYEGLVNPGLGPNPAPQPGDGSRIRADNFAFPDAQDVNSHWAGFIYWLTRRYTKTTGNATRWADAIELVNEPNSQCWPQGVPAGGPSDPGGATSHCMVSNIMAAAVVRREQAMADLANAGTPVQVKPILMAPSTDDYYVDESRTPPVNDSAQQTSYATFTNNLAALLTASAFSAPLDMIWSHHNYNDESFDYGLDTSYPGQSFECPTLNRAHLVHDYITGRWTGGPYGEPEAPYVFITEGGVVRSRLWKQRWFGDENYNDATGMNNKHGELVQRTLNRMQGENDGRGIGMVAQFLNWTDPNLDSGIRNAGDPSGARRQPAYDNWSNATSHPRWRD
jgi:hypothetical protein